MYELKNIQNSVQEVAEAISSILNVEVTIINTKLIRLAATGKYKKLIGEQLPKGCSYEYIMYSKKSENIIRNDINKRCLQCESYNQCEEMASMGYPILDSNNNILGVIGLIAFNKKQGDAINKNYKNIKIFLKKLNSLLVGNLKYEKNIEMLSLKNKEISNIVNSLDSGIILTDSNLNIKSYNGMTMKLLNSSSDELIDKSIYETFENYNKNNLSAQKVINLRSKNKKLDELLVKTIANTVDNKIKSYILQISKYTSAVKNAYNIIEGNNDIDLDDIIGQSDIINNSITLARQVATSSSSVMIRGESGTGKELFARAIHNNSQRSNNPFIAINCASIPDNLLESELFGYEKGAFSGANSSGKIGRFELADGGTLFLDEIGDLPIHLQPKLLRVLQDGSFVRLGGNQTIKVNFRLIAATNRKLEEMVENNEFREDLYFRLNVIPIHVPPLRQRREDIPIIANIKLSEYCHKLGKMQKKFSPEILSLFQKSEWKGNVRELENIIEYLVNISNDEIIDLDLLPYNFQKSYREDSLNDTNPEVFRENISGNLEDMLSVYEKNILEYFLKKYGRATIDKQKIADKLGINISTLYRKLYRYNLK
ncbi:MAG: sigma-54 interaction domain-containing protein [Peptoniphilaceae bacterium]